MPATDLLRRLARNNAWANLRLHRACARLTRADYHAPRTSFFPSIHLTLNHILIIDWYYLDALEEGGRGPALYADPAPFAELAPLTAAQAASDRRLIAFCDGLAVADLSREVITDRGEGRRPSETVAGLLLHLFQHQIHHRGQVHAMLAGTAVPPPQLDEFFLEQEAPLRAAEMKELGF